MPGHDLAKLFMGASTVGERGQVVIPAEVRERLGIKPGDKLLVLVHPDETGVSFVRFEKLQEAQQSLQTVLLEYEHHGANTPEEGGPS
ncbi:AbrB/MazE/SpoVT family DNA-binding domain-containing protein [bacterium]|nr:AbrB/MazE/SpoVT family DNA-binding domain-containing protein [bacterium]